MSTLSTKAGVPAMALVFGMLGFGCAHHPKEVASEVPPAAPTTATPAAPPKATPPPAPAPPAPAPGLSQAQLNDAFFDFDSASLRTDAREALDRDTQLLRDHPDEQVRLEGYCDERGSEEYNQALGERRAFAARDYLEAAGIAGSRITTVSYGKDRPFCTQHEEDCWQQNRRARVALVGAPIRS